MLDDPAVLSSMPVEMLEKKPKKLSAEEFRTLREDVHKTTVTASSAAKSTFPRPA